MDIKADSVEVTDNGVQTRFSTQNATIPKKTRTPASRVCDTGALRGRIDICPPRLRPKFPLLC